MFSFVYQRIKLNAVAARESTTDKSLYFVSTRTNVVGAQLEGALVSKRR